ncbi:hypothetical protein ILYODFUR_019847 [Ilyodon furcidens]|uniref:C-type lectin domain-containing protein n=1 Tax=Ilyodon furcidens TaxID=33524 RepID=A0ABV0T9G0_9TELE
MQWNQFLLFMMGQCCFIDCQLYEYLYIKEEKTWAEAQQYCREKHTDLATASNMTDTKRLLNISEGNMGEAWIGLYDQTAGKRKWYWSLPGVEFNESETNWASGEALDTGSENCGFIGKNLTWGDYYCDLKLYFLCYDDQHEGRVTTSLKTGVGGDIGDGFMMATGEDQCSFLFEDKRNASQELYFINEMKTWLEAQSYCRQNHTDLASGLNQVQLKQLNNAFQSVRMNTFFGPFRDTWRWSDGSSFSFRHWNLQFNFKEFNSGQCAMTVLHDEGRWKNANCTVRKTFICYDDKVILIKEKKNWMDALSYCRNNYRDLVTITNTDEQRWVQEKAKKASTPFVWIGLRFNCTLNVWLWVCPEMVSYTNNASDGGTDDCHMSGAMETGGQHKWFQKNGTEEFNFICFC